MRERWSGRPCNSDNRQVLNPLFVNVGMKEADQAHAQDIQGTDLCWSLVKAGDKVTY